MFLFRAILGIEMAVLPFHVELFFMYYLSVALVLIIIYWCWL